MNKKLTQLSNRIAILEKQYSQLISEIKTLKTFISSTNYFYTADFDKKVENYIDEFL